MDLFVDLKVPAVDGSQWTAAERQREEKSLCGNDLQTLLDFCGSPQNDAVERVMGTENRIQPIDLENNISVRSMRLDTIMYRFRPLGKPVAC